MIFIGTRARVTVFDRNNHKKLILQPARFGGNHVDCFCEVDVSKRLQYSIL